MTDNNNNNHNSTAEDDYFREEELEEERREIKEAEKHQLRLEFATNIIAAHKYCLRNVIHTVKGFDCEILYLPRHKNPRDSDTYFTRIFKVRILESEDPLIECIEKRSGWGGTGELYLGQVYINLEKAEGFMKEALSIAAALLKIPENEEEQERFFAELEPEEHDDNRSIDEPVIQQDHNHELDIVIAELCADVEIAFFEYHMLR